MKKQIIGFIIIPVLAFGSGVAFHHWILHKRVTQSEVLLYRSNQILTNARKVADAWEKSKDTCIPIGEKLKKSLANK